MAIDQVIQSPYPELTLPETCSWHFLFDQPDGVGPKDDQPIFIDSETEKQLK